MKPYSERTIKLYDVFTSFDRYFDYQVELIDDLTFQAGMKISKLSQETIDSLMIAYMDSILELSGCIDSPAEHQWHCDPTHCPDWNEPQKGIGSLLTVASIDTAGRLGRGYE